MAPSPGTLRLRTLALREIHLPLVEPFRTAAGVVEARRVLLLELEDVDGTTAWSECVAEALPTYWPDTVDTCWLAVSEWIAPRVIGTDVAGPAEAAAVIARHVRGHRMARAAVEMGMWTLLAARERRPLAATLHAASHAARASAGPRARVDVGVVLGLHDEPAMLAERARAVAAEGYRRIKLKVEPGRDIAFVEAVRDVLGGDVRLSVDANCRYSLDDPAHLHALERLDACELAWIEQPLGWDDLQRHAELQRRLATPICLDESVSGLPRALDAIALGAGRMINLKPGRVGGFAEAIAIHDRCAAVGVPVWCGGMLETGIGRACNVALASLPNFTEPGDLSPSRRYWVRDVVRPAWTMEEGQLRVPLDRPGLGVEVDTGWIDELTQRRRLLA